MRERPDQHAKGDDRVPTELDVGKPSAKNGDDADHELEEQDEGIGELETSTEGSSRHLCARWGSTSAIAACVSLSTYSRSTWHPLALL